MNPRIFRHRRIVLISTGTLALLSLTALLQAPVWAQAGGKGTSPASKATNTSDDADVVSILMDAESGHTGPGGIPPVWYQQFSEAVRNAQNGKHALAEQQFLALLKTQPHLAPAWANLAIIEAQTKRLAAGIIHMNRALVETQDKGQKVTFLLQLAGMCGRAGQWNDSASAAQRAMAIAPAGSPSAKTAGAYFGLALMQLGRYKDALVVLKPRPVLLGEQPIVADLRYIFAEQQAGNLAEAFADAKDLLHRYPGDAKAINAVAGVGDAAVRLGRMDIALDAFQFAYAARPSSRELGFNVVTAAVRVQSMTNDPALHKEMDTVATGVLESLLKRYPDDAKVHFEYGALLFSASVPDKTQLKRAALHLRYAAAHEPNNVTYLTQLALAVVLQGPDTLNEATNLFQAAIKLDPNYGMAHIGLGYAYEQQAETDKQHAAKHLNDALDQYAAVIAQKKLSDADVKARSRQAGILYTLNRKDEAYHAWEAIIARYPTTYGLDVAAETASRMIADKRYTDAARLYTQILVQRPKDVSAFVGLGQTEELLGKYSDAEQQYEKGLAVEPTNATAALALGSLLTKHLDRPKDSVAVYEKALKAAATPGGLANTAAQDQANQIRLQLGSDYAEAQKDEDALRIYHTLTVRNDDPNRTVYLLTAPRFLIARKRYADAEKELTEMYRERPTETEVGYELARAQELNAHGADAIATLRGLALKAKTDPADNVRALIQIAALEVRLNELEEGAKQYEDVLRLDPTQQLALTGLSGARQRQGHPEMAGTFLETLTLAGDKEPNLQLVSDLYALYATMDHTPERYRAFVVKLADRYPNSRVSQGFALSSLLDATSVGNPANRATATPIVERLLTANPKDPVALYWRGLIRETDGKKADAIADYTAAVEANYGNGPAIAALKRLGAPVPVAPTTPPTAPPNPPAPAKA